MSVVLCCRDAAAILDDEAGTLQGAGGASFSFHMTICVYCRRYRDQLQATVELLRALPHTGGAEAEPGDAEVDAILGLLGASDAGGDHQT